LLAWNKDSYTERFLALLPSTCVLQHKSVHLYQTSSLLPGHPPIVASASLRLLISYSAVGTSNTLSFGFPSLSLFLWFALSP
jgi:hypothetical protein